MFAAVLFTAAVQRIVDHFRWPGWVVVGQTSARGLRVHLVLDQTSAGRGPWKGWMFTYEVKRSVHALLRSGYWGPLDTPALELAIPPACVAHTDCAEHRSLGEACWLAARNPGIPPGP